MRKLRIPLILGALLCCLLAFTACGRVRLARPAGLLIDSDTLELTWYEVSEADRYTLEINGEETTVRTNSYSLDTLAPGTYTIRVSALDLDGLYRESAWSESIGFVREEESGLSYRLINSNSAYEVVGKVGS